ncbi:MAG: alpha/beta hydrolase [Anaerolineaceae bacterium]|nr:MAG: alpha/beta hydrolase [Anaerolineaceae bacterium]
MPSADTYTAQTLHVEGHTLAAWTFNAHLSPDERPPIIFMHGITASNSMWQIGQTPHVRAHHRWYALSLPGHHPATFPPDHLALEIQPQAHARIMTAAIRQLVGERPVILAGHSTGGFLALSIAALSIAAQKNSALKVAGVVSVCGFACGRWMGALGLLQRLAGGGIFGHLGFRAALRVMAVHPAIFKAAVSLYAHDRRALYRHPPTLPTLSAMYHHAARLDASAMRQYFYRLRRIDISANLGHITAPMLVIAGQYDPIVPPSQSRRIAEAVPNSRLVLIDGAGHLPMSERAADYDRAMSDWLAQHFDPQDQNRRR